MKFSLLVPRKSLIKKKYQKLMPQVEICTGYDKSKLFCKSKAINKAAQKATGDIFIICDADVIFDPDLVNKIAPIIHLHPWIIPFKNAIFLTKDATDRFIREGLPPEVKIKKEDIERSFFGKGQLMNVVKRECYEAVHGFDERFKGWGLEDFAFRLSLDTICGIHFNMDENIYHLWHPRAKRNHKHSKKNKHLYLRYLKAASSVMEMKRLINERFK